ncbi:MAG: NAD(P)/FAD-dependent oxidoreductase [Actinobacteria bacterium]|nr:NAD(P)/FAD-dependent oxidoreductase [Actinomycetota bacterium]
MEAAYDAIVIGGGHNGLVAAAYMAAEGRRVLVLEARPIVGGACITEEFHPGFRVSSLAYFCGELQQKVIDDLELKKHGLKLIVPDPSTFAMFRDGSHVLLWSDLDKMIAELRRFAPDDVEAFLAFGMELKRYWDLISPTTMREPPTLAELDAIFSDPDDRRMFLEFMTEPATDILNSRFESENLKGMMAFPATSSANFGTDAPGTGLELISNSCAELEGEFGVWGHVEGGMGAISEALRSAAESRGVTVQTDTAVAEILVSKGRVEGVRLADGSTRTAPVVLSNADPHVTFTKLVPEAALAESFRKQVKKIDFRGTMARVHYAVSELPRYAGVTTTAPGPEHSPMTLLDFTLPNIRKAVAAYEEGKLPDQLSLELATPSASDPTLAPEGKHVVTIGVQYTPFELAGQTWDDYRDEFEGRVRATMDEFAPGFSDSVLGCRVVTPLDLEREYHLTEGNIFHGAMLMSQWYNARPIVGCANYRTPVQGLYLCGAGTHPGGAVTGANGHNAAMAVRRDGADSPTRAEWDRRAATGDTAGAPRPGARRPVADRVWAHPAGRSVMVWAARQRWSRGITHRLRRR